MKWKKIKQLSFYVVFTLVVFILFLYLRFPSDIVREIIAAKVADAYPNCFVSIEKIQPHFPLRLKLEKTALWLNSRTETEIRLDTIDISPNLWNLLEGEANLDLKIEWYGGRASGYLRSPDVLSLSGPLSSEIKFNNIQVQNVVYLKYLLGRDVLGKLKGSVSYVNKGKESLSRTGHLNFTITNGSYPIFNKALGMDRLDFTEVEGQLILKDKTLRIERINLSGDRVRCAIKGDIIISQDDFRNSQLNLLCNFDLRTTNTSNKMVFTITGTFTNPIMDNKTG